MSILKLYNAFSDSPQFPDVSAHIAVPCHIADPFLSCCKSVLVDGIGVLLDSAVSGLLRTVLSTQTEILRDSTGHPEPAGAWRGENSTSWPAIIELYITLDPVQCGMSWPASRY